jgi:Fe-S-cluster containining protein
MAGEPFRTKLVNGRCFFLDDENRCRIHTEISYDAKPPVCRSFPLTVLDVGGKRYARLSFWCPTVVANVGKPLDQQSRWLKETAKHTDHRTAPLMINEKAELPVRDFERVHLALRRLVVGSALPMGDRLAAASALVRRLDAASGKGKSVDADLVIVAAESDGAAVLAGEARRGGHPSGGRRVLSMYLLQDRQGGRFAILARFFSIILFSAGVTKLHSRAVPGRASWRQLRRVAFDPSPVSDDLVTRYICSKLDSRRYVAGEATLVTGFNLLLAAYGMINVLARIRAASEGRQVCNDEDVRLAVGAADLLVVEHPGLYQGRLHGLLTRAALGSPSLGGDLLACL